MHAGLKVQQISHYHGLGEILKAALRSGMAGQVQVETSHRIRRGAGSVRALRGDDDMQRGRGAAERWL